MAWLLLGWLLPVILWPLEVAGASPEPRVYPMQGNGFASYIVGGFFGLGVLILFARWTSRRPKRPS
jgi:hypothetical protein